MQRTGKDGFGLEQIGQIAIPVTDVDRAITFYRDVLGMTFLFQAPPGLGFFDCGGVRIMLDGPAKAQAGKGGAIYYKVSNLDDSYRELIARGAPSVAEPHLIAKMPDHDLWMAFLKDPDENVVGLMCEVR